MEGKFSYFDIIAYLVPGVVVVFVLAYLARTHGLSLPSATGNDLIDGAGFFAVSFVAGHLVQSLARERYSSPSRTGTSWFTRLLGQGRVFREGMPSELALCPRNTDSSRAKGRRILSREKISRILDALGDAGLVDEDTKARLLTGEDDEKCRRVTHDAYRTLRSLATAKNLSEKADRANEAYNFYRGMSETAEICGVMLLISAATWFVHLIPLDPWLAWVPDGVTALLHMLLGFAAIGADRIFLHRALGAGTNHVREVFELAGEVLARRREET